MKIDGFNIDLHVHTYEHSKCSSAPVDHIITEAKSIGLDGICITDHNYVWTPDKIEELRDKHNFLVLRGNEIKTELGDMLVFGMYKDIKGVIKLSDLKKEVEEEKGFLIAAHPFRGSLTFGVKQQPGLTIEKASKYEIFKYVDGVEILNGKVSKKENNLTRDVAIKLNLPGTGGSDVHEVNETGKFVTRFNVTINNEVELVNALKSQDYKPVRFRKTE